MDEMQVWSTDPLPEELRFSAWTEKMRTLHMDWNLTTSVEDSYTARVRHRGVRGTRIADARCKAFSGRHDPSTDSADTVGIQLHLDGHMRCKYAGDRFALEPGDLFVWAGWMSGTFESVEDHRQLTLLVPRARVPSSLDMWLERSRAVSARPGTGLLSIAADQIRGVAREMDRLPDAALNQTVDCLLDLLGTAFTPARKTTDRQRSTLVADVQRYILERLDDTTLSASSIATAHGTSVRTLHLAFSESGTSVGRWTRQQRLERCRRELASATGSTTVTEIAFRWGFNDTAHFSRAFKQEYGVPPSSVMTRARQHHPQ